METNFEKLIKILTKWDTGGARTLSNGTLQICHVPHVGPQAWLHKIFAPLEMGQVAQLEAETNLMFPAVFKEFLKNFNGINLFSDCLSIDGLRSNFVRTGDDAVQPYHLVSMNKERPHKCPKSWLFIGGYSWDGSKIFFDTNDSSSENKIYRCDRNSGKILNEWASFWEWLFSEVDRLSQMYDEKGIKLDKSAPTVPTV